MSPMSSSMTITPILPIIFKYQHTKSNRSVTGLNTGIGRSQLFAIFRRFGPDRSVISVDSAESGSVTAFTHTRE